MYAMPDGGNEVRIAVLEDALDGACEVSRWIRGATNPYDPEDLAAFGGNLWIGDFGDNARSRETIALIRGDPASGESTVHRLAFPDDRPRDAETLLIDANGMPILVSKWFGVGEVFVPRGGLSVEDLPADSTTPLEHRGEMAFPMTSTVGGPLGSVGSTLATGGAVNEAGTVAAVRTYTDAYLFADASGDLVHALTTEAVRVPLPGEPQGEAIAFTADGDLLTASEVGDASLDAEGSATTALPPIGVVRGAEQLAWDAMAQRGESTTTFVPGDPEADHGAAGIDEADRASSSTVNWAPILVAGTAGIALLGVLAAIAAYVARRRSP
ncbi:hypothetical protein HT102_02705 [Hoyosella sp. G463]|uniref:Esterase-like activity of phytase family protein n=1 Tax=Lolliginicoccus lacisalsi TaxID=2742202 RepID=A0A927PL20_9ACTN|nr:hypothetical protein [Lolliginicoccus lacisalsi]